MKITIAQLNPTVGDVKGNLAKAASLFEECKADEPDLIVFPELFLIGYPPKDFLLRTWLINMTHAAIDELAGLSKKYPKTGLLIGAPTTHDRVNSKGLHNSAVLIHDGKVVSISNKSLLPTYDVFDEARYFDPAQDVFVVPFKDEILGISICEDAWNDADSWTERCCYDFDPIDILAAKGATLLVNISASPFEIGKEELRFGVIASHARKHGLPFVYVNQVGGNDELVFDGRSFAVDKDGNAIEALPGFEEAVVTIDTSRKSLRQDLYKPREKTESVHDALVLGIRDYLHKSGFSKAVVGLSGGIDSALTCCLAVEALGRENVLGISMPSPYSSAGSIEDSRKLAANLGIDFKVIPISDVYRSYLDILEPNFEGKPYDVTEENIQARIRGNILMAFSNKFGYIVLSTGNKSELAMGYCTLYGDMSGGLSVLSDIPKTMVYDLSHYVNREREIIPIETIEKAPSAELRPNQKDQDSLPPYPVLDQILHLFVEHDASIEEIVAQGFDRDMALWVINTVDKNEYKRKQAAPGLKVTQKAFGVGRRIPIVAKREF